MIFRTSVKLTLLLLILALVFGRLGWWQLERKAEKEAMLEQFVNAPMLSVRKAVDQEQLFARVAGFGRYDTERHILLDNRMFKGRPGVHVLTPFTLEDGATILVNRGWLPIPPDRSRLPEVPTDDSLRAISGRLNRLPGDGPRLGGDDTLTPSSWPQLVTYFDLEPVEEALGLSLLPWIVQLDPDREDGFSDRQWKVAVMEPEVHGGYAVQWFGLMTAAIVIWLTLGIHTGMQQHRRPTEESE